MAFPRLWLLNDIIYVQFSEKGMVMALDDWGHVAAQHRAPGDASRIYWTQPDPLVNRLPDDRRDKTA